jgi:hypothetical protein
MGNPVSLLDPDGRAPDIFLYGTDGHVMRVEAPGRHIHMAVNAPLAGVAPIDPIRASPGAAYAIGVQRTIGASAVAGMGVEKGAFSTTALFLNTDYDGYRYHYRGTQGGFSGGFDLGIEGNVEVSILIGVSNSGREGDANPESFAGVYSYESITVGGGQSINGYVGYQESASADGIWTIHEMVVGSSLGTPEGTPVQATYGSGTGSSRLLNGPAIPTAQRSFLDRASNILSMDKVNKIIRELD